MVATLEYAGQQFAAMHLLLEFWGADHLSDADQLEQALKRAALAANATVLHCHLHSFDGAGGVTGVALLAESHISIHTWPEHDYAALDIFMCGGSKPHKAVEMLKLALQPEKFDLKQVPRGLIS